MTPTVIIVTVAFCVAATTPLVWLPLLRRRGVLDVPNQRSSHSGTAVRGCGLAPASAVVVAVAVAHIVQPPGTPAFAALLLLGLTCAAVGLVEDLRGLSVPGRLAGQLAVGALFGLWLWMAVGTPWWSICLIALAVASYVNMANFMDGVDGMSALHGLVTGGYYAVVGLHLGLAGVALAGLVTAAAFAGFAPWNLIRGRTFLGDVGSYLLGALVAGGGLIVFIREGEPLLALGPALPYIADTTVTLLFRLSRGEDITRAHRSHVYQRLTDLGMTHCGSAQVVAAASLLCSVAALVSSRGGWYAAIAALFIGAVLGCYLGAPRFLASGRSGWRLHSVRRMK